MTLLETLQNDTDHEAIYGRALADLATGNLDKAIAGLEKIAAGEDRAALWNDVAAIRLEIANRTKKTAILPHALTAADRALQLDSKFAPALFNRAATLSALGFRRESGRAWQAFVAVESHGVWASEASRRLNAANRKTDDASWLAERQRLDSGSDTDLIVIAQRFPQQARTWAEVEIQARWAKAFLDGDIASASHHLRIARVIGTAVQRFSGEMLLFDAVGTIDRASNASAHRLAKAQLAYQEGRLAMAKGKFSEALSPLQHCAAEFDRLRSPMGLLCQAYAANTVAELHRNDEALAILRAVQIDERENREYRALDAHVSWEIGLCEALRGRWSIALESLSRAHNLFSGLSERRSQGRVLSILGEGYDVLGQFDRGWDLRVSATRLLAEEGDTRSVHLATAGGTFALMRSSEWDTALSLSAIDVATARAINEPALIARSFMRRSIICTHLDQHQSARQAIRAGREEANRIPDVSAAGRTNADLDLAEALVMRNISGRQSLALIDRAIAAYSRAGLDIYLPDLYTERGRALLRLGDDASASRAFDVAIEALVRQRERVQTVDLRSGIFDNAAGLFEEAIRLSVRHRDAQRIFNLQERSRARVLLDSITAGSPEIPAEPPRLDDLAAVIGDGTFIEYSILPEQVVATVVHANGVTLEQLPIKKAVLQASVERMNALIIERRPLREIRFAAADLYDELIASLSIAPDTTIVLSPDGALGRVPWAALYDRKSMEFMVERHPIVIAPSAAVFIANHARVMRIGANRPRRVLAIGNPSFDVARFPQFPTLSAAEAEARAVSGKYAQGESWLREDATLERFQTMATSYEVIHFAGHSVSLPGGESFLLFAGSDSSANDRLYAGETARMPFKSTRLVILASCSSLVGPTNVMEGMPSIGRGFLAGGVPAVIGLLWDIEDTAARDLFVRLHERLASGKSAALSLTETQRELLHSANPQLAHPATWSGIQIFGGSESDRPGNHAGRLSNQRPVRRAG